MIQGDGKTANRVSLALIKAHLDKVFLFAVLLCFLTVTTICVVQALTWVNEPFPGFLYNARVAVAPIGQYHWTGTQAGLKYPDKILNANGKPMASIKDLKKTVNDAGIGTPIIYTVKRGERIFKATVVTMRFGWPDLLMTFGSLLLGGLAYIIIGVIVFVMKPNLKVSWIFLTVCLFLSLWSITIFDMQATHFGFIRFYLMATALIPGITLHFCVYFPEPRPFILRHPRLQILPYLISFAILVPMLIIYPRDGFQLFWSLSLVYLFISTTSLVYPSAQAYFRSESAIARQRAKILLLGAALAFPLPVFANLSQQLMGSFLGLRIQTNFLALPLIIFPAAVAYAIIKHNLFDVDVYIKRAVGYTIMTAIVIGAYVLMSLTLSVIVGKYQIAQSRTFPILFTLGVILIFNPLRDRIQTLVDRVFFRKEYDYGQIVDKIGNTMTSLLDLRQILQKLAGTFSNDMFINNSAFMLLNPATAEYQVYMAEGEKKQDIEKAVLRREDPIVEIIENVKKELTKYDVLEDRQYSSVSNQCAASFDMLKASLMMPFVYQERVIGLFSLGEKKSGKFFNRQDIDLLHAIANQGAVAIENARLFQENLEKQRMEEELAIGRELQMSMLPSDCPVIEGFEISAFSASAREVGGDFYDFIDMGEDKAGIVIGDVTGKSVSGALVMSASRSVFRMLSEEGRSVAENMILANRRIKKDVKSGMFVALLYAVLDGKNKAVSLCSAGQTQPVFRSEQAGGAKLLETRGDTFPLGILDDAAYEETRLELTHGDVVVLYTDGIVEAMNENKEIFGFDRLLDIVNNSPAGTAESLLEDVKRSVNEFAGSASQHDDITVIVIRTV